MAHVDSDDPLGVDPLLEARARWDAEMAEARRRWDVLYPTASPTYSAPAARPQIPPPGDGGGRPYPAEPPYPLELPRPVRPQPPQQWQPPLQPPPAWSPPLPAVDELDLTRFDHLAQQTAKIHPYDDELPQPPQSPAWVPPPESQELPP